MTETNHLENDVLYSTALNDPMEWVNKAQALTNAAILIDDSRSMYRDQETEDEPHTTNLVFVAAMLRGMALENLFKAIELARSGTSKTGKIPTVFKRRGHKLDVWMNAVDLQNFRPTRTVLEMLQRLTQICIGFGRYPTPIKSLFGPEGEPATKPVMLLKWHTGRDNLMLSKLAELLDTEIRKLAEESATVSRA